MPVPPLLPWPPVAGIGGAAAPDSAAVAVQQTAADYYTQEEMAKVRCAARGTTRSACPSAVAALPCSSEAPSMQQRKLTSTSSRGAHQLALLNSLLPQFQKPKKKKERKLKKKAALTEEELAALEAEAAARGGSFFSLRLCCTEACHRFFRIFDNLLTTLTEDQLAALEAEAAARGELIRLLT